MKNIPGFPNYAVTRDGKVFVKRRIDSRGRKAGRRFLSPVRQINGRFLVCLYSEGKSYQKQVHRLVLENFVGPCPEGMECRHLDGNPANNHLNNLKWGTKVENAKDRELHGRTAKGLTNGMSILSEDQVRIIFDAYNDGVATQRELAKCFGTCQRTINLICRKITWKHLWEN